MKKVAYYIGGLNRGGTEVLILDVCRQAERMPFDLVIVYRSEGNLSDAFRSTNVPMYKIARKRSAIGYLWAMRKWVLKEHIDILHAQTSLNTILACIFTLFTSAKVVKTNHGFDFADTNLFYRWLVCSRCSRILNVSDYVKQYYLRKWHIKKTDKWGVVYNGIDFGKIESAVKSEELRVNSKIKLAMVGNFVNVRSQIVIARAIARLDAMRLEPKALDAAHLAIPEFDFYFIGTRVEQEAALYDDCVKYCEEHQLSNVHFLGSRGDVPSILKSIDGFVYSSARDTFGIAVLEAIVAGLPIVVNDWPVIQEVCNLGLNDNNRAIRFFETENVEDCARKISELLKDIKNNHSALEADCQLAAEAAKEKYSIQNHINNLNLVYQTL